METRWNFVHGPDGWTRTGSRRPAPGRDVPRAQLRRRRPARRPSPARRAHIQNAVLAELEARADLRRTSCTRRATRSSTTIDPRAQQQAEAAVRDVLEGPAGQPVRPALVAVEPEDRRRCWPTTAARTASASTGRRRRRSPARRSSRSTSVALLEEGKGLGETYDGTSGRDVRGPGRTGPQLRRRVLRQGLHGRAGDEEVDQHGVLRHRGQRRSAPRRWPTPRTRRASPRDLNGENGRQAGTRRQHLLGGGDTRVSTLEMASAYAHVRRRRHAPHAAPGRRRSSARTATIDVVGAGGTTKPAFDADNSDKQPADRPQRHRVAAAGDRVLEDGVPGRARQCAGKTGTHQLGSHRGQREGLDGRLHAADLRRGVHGRRDAERQADAAQERRRRRSSTAAGCPARSGKTFMNTISRGRRREDFGRFEPIGTTTASPRSPRTTRTRTRTTATGGSGDGNGNGDDNGDGDGDGDGERQQPDDDPTRRQPTNRDPTVPDRVIPADRPEPDRSRPIGGR